MGNPPPTLGHQAIKKYHDLENKYNLPGGTKTPEQIKAMVTDQAQQVGATAGQIASGTAMGMGLNKAQSNVLGQQAQAQNYTNAVQTGMEQQTAIAKQAEMDKKAKSDEAKANQANMLNQVIGAGAGILGAFI